MNLSSRFSIEKPILFAISGLGTVYLLINVIQTAHYINTQELSETVGSLFYLRTLQYYAIYLIIFLGIASFILYLLKTFRLKGFNNRKSILIHLLFSVLSGIYSYIIALILQWLFGIYDLTTIQSLDHLNLVLSEIDTSFLVYTSILGIIYIAYYYTSYSESEIQRVKINDCLTQAKLNLLKSQIEPHFLFNTLNTISSLIYSDKEKAYKVITDLSDVFRESLLLKDTQFLSIDDELIYLQKYLDLIQVRFENKVCYEFNVDDSLSESMIPAFLLQPLVENAIKHGLTDTTNSLNVSVNIFDKGNEEIEISIKNSGSPINSGSKLKVGTENGIKLIKDRLELIYPGNFQFQLRNIDHDLFNVEAYINLPSQTPKSLL